MRLIAALKWVFSVHHVNGFSVLQVGGMGSCGYVWHEDGQEYVSARWMTTRYFDHQLHGVFHILRNYSKCRKNDRLVLPLKLLDRDKKPCILSFTVTGFPHRAFPYIGQPVRIAGYVWRVKSVHWNDIESADFNYYELSRWSGGTELTITQFDRQFCMEAPANVLARKNLRPVR